MYLKGRKLLKFLGLCSLVLVLSFPVMSITGDGDDDDEELDPGYLIEAPLENVDLV